MTPGPATPPGVVATCGVPSLCASRTHNGRAIWIVLYDIHAALKTMRHAKVRRLPVVNAEGRLQGILCMNDIALRAEESHGKRVPDLSYSDAMSTFKALCEHRAATVAAPA